MPLYPLECNDDACGDRKEALLLLREYEAEHFPPCPTCAGPMHRIYVAHHSQAQHFDPIVYHESPDGRMRFPGRTDAKVPDGYERKEIRTSREYDTFRRRVEHNERNKVDQNIESEHAFLHYSEEVNRPDLRMAMQSMPRQWRDFARLAIERGNAKRPRGFDPNFFVECMEFDASNRTAYGDEDRRGRARK